MSTLKTTNNQQIPNQPLPDPYEKPRRFYFYIISTCILGISLLSPFLLQSPASQVDPHLISQKPSLDITKVDEITELSIQLSQNEIRYPSNTEQTFPMLVSLKVKGLEHDYREPVDLVCMIDPDIKDDKIESVRNTLRYLLTFLSDKDRLSILVCNDHEPIFVPFTNTTTGNTSKILSDLAAMDLRGRSNLKDCFYAASNVLYERETVNRATGVLLISDELDNSENCQVRGLHQKKCKDSEPETTILTPFALKRPIFFTNPMTTLTDGDFFFLIDKLDDIDETFAFVENLSILQTQIAERVEFIISPHPSEFLNNLEILKVHGDTETWRKDGRSIIIESSSVMTRRRKDFVLDFKISSFDEVPFRRGAIASCQAILTLSDGSQITKKADLKMTFVYNKMRLESEEDKKEVMRNYYRVKGGELMNEVVRLADEGKYEEVKEALKDYKEILENCEVKDDVLIKKMVMGMEELNSYDFATEWRDGYCGLRYELERYGGEWMKEDLTLDSNFVLNNIEWDRSQHFNIDPSSW